MLATIGCDSLNSLAQASPRCIPPYLHNAILTKADLLVRRRAPRYTNKQGSRAHESVSVGTILFSPPQKSYRNPGENQGAQATNGNSPLWSLFARQPFAFAQCGGIHLPTWTGKSKTPDGQLSQSRAPHSLLPAILFPPPLRLTTSRSILFAIAL